MAPFSLILLLSTLILPAMSTYNPTLQLETCIRFENHVTVHPDADVTIGVVLPIHRAGGGVYGCGNPTPVGVEVYEAMKWAIQVLNTRSGLVSGGEDNKGSLVPGVEIGLHVYDSCEHESLAVEHLTSLFPVLRSGSSECDHLSKNTSLIIGVVDASDAGNKPEVAEALRDFQIPIINLSFATLVSPQKMAQVLTSAARNLQWTTITVLHEDDEHSISVAKKIVHSTPQNGPLCVTAVHALPKTSGDPLKINKMDLKTFRKAFRSATGGLSERSAVVVIASSDQVATKFLQVMSEFPESVENFQWLFSWIPPPRAISEIGKSISQKSRLFSIAPFPDKILQFEQYWSSARGSYSQPQNRWFWEYVMAQKLCKIPDAMDAKYEKLPICSDLTLTETALQSLIRTSRAVPAVHSVFTFANAVYRAWETECKRVPGICPGLRRLSRREFGTRYLSPVEYMLGGHEEDFVKSRAPRDVVKAAESGKLALTQYLFEEGKGVLYKQVIEFDDSGKESRVLDKKFTPTPTVCTTLSCRKCVRPRQARVEHHLQDLEFSESQAFGNKNVDVLVPLLLPLHGPGLSPFECSSELDAEAVQNLEAALWVLEKINQDRDLFGGLTIGLHVIDTCGSTATVTQKVAGFVGASGFDLSSGLVFVSAAGPEETLAASAVLKSLNMSLISTADLTPHSDLRQGLYQVPRAARSLSRALLDLVEDVGWRAVSVVHQNDKPHTSIADDIEKMAKQIGLGICVHRQYAAVDEDSTSIDRLVQQLIQDSQQTGVRAILLITDGATTRKILSSYNRFPKSDVGLVFMSLGDIGEISALEEQILGLIGAQETTGEVSEFVNHFNNLASSSTGSSSWFDTLSKQASDMDGSIIAYIHRASTTHTIQAMAAIASGIMAMRNEVCPDEAGICERLEQLPDLQGYISSAIGAGISKRMDDLGTIFRFDDRGIGNGPIDVFNCRLDTEGFVIFQTVATYDREFTRLNDIVTYTNKELVPIETVGSNCVRDCDRCSQNLFKIESLHRIYVAVTMDMHKRSNDSSMSCGTISERTFQDFEGILWALDKINRDNNLLSGIDLGLVAIDTCSNKDKTTVDVSNFLSGTLGNSAIHPDDILAVIVDGSTKVTQSVADLTVPMHLTTIAVTADGSELGKYSSNILRMSTPMDTVLGAIFSILKKYDFNLVSLVSTDVDDRFVELSDEFVEQAETEDIRILVSEMFRDGEDATSVMDVIVHRLKIQQNAGAKVVVLFLPPDITSQLLDAVRRLQLSGRSKLGDFLFIAMDFLGPFQGHPNQSAGSLVLKESIGPVQKFKEHFENLGLEDHRSVNPWIREYFDKVYDCRGPWCPGNHRAIMNEKGFDQSPSATKSINALYAVATALDSVLSGLCGSEIQNCDWQTYGARYLSQQIGRLARDMRFQSHDGTSFVFDATEGHVIGNVAELFNLREVDGMKKFVHVGVLRIPEDELILNESLIMAYDVNGTQVPMSKVSSSCHDTGTCVMGRSSSSKPVQKSYMKVPSDQDFYITVLTSVTNSGNNFFSCGSRADESSIQNLMALMYGLELVNKNETVLPKIKLGSLVFDYCNRKQKAEEQVFSFLATEGAMPFWEAEVNTRSVVSALTYGSQVAESLSPLYESALVPQIALPTAPLHVTSREVSEALPRTIEVEVIADVLVRMNWKFVTLVHTGFKSRGIYKSFIEIAKKSKICISQSVELVHELSIPDLSYFLFERLSGANQEESKVIVLLLEEPGDIKKVLDSARLGGVLNEFVWIAMQFKEDKPNVLKALQGHNIDFFLIQPEAYEIPGFRKFYSKFNLRHHSPIPKNWFQSFWQQHFRCHIPESEFSMSSTFAQPCKGTENLSVHPLTPNSIAFHTVRTVMKVSETLHDYLRRYCLHGDAARSLDDCGEDAKPILWREMRKAWNAQKENCAEGDCGPLKVDLAYLVLQLKRTKTSQVYQAVGLWKDGDLSLRVEGTDFLSGAKTESICHVQCQKCLQQLSIDPEELNMKKPTLYSNFYTQWGIVIASLSVIGMVLVLICALYFIWSFQVTVGTTILGYLILFGVFLLYAINFAFILAPTEHTCGIRRFGLGLAYAIIFSGMLVKIMNIWRTAGSHYLGGEMYHLASPATLLIVATGLVIIQIALSTSWLFLIPPTIGLHGGEWRCHPASTFEDELVLSLVYVMLLLAVVLLFSIITFKSEANSYEARWINACCILTVITWISWTVLVTRIYHTYRDLATTSSNLTCATVILLLMYLRKMYVYHSMVKSAKRKDKLVQQKQILQQQLKPTLPLPNMYGTVSLRHSSMFQSSPLMTQFTSSNMALLPSNDDANSSGSSDCTGSTQVQATDLYPLDMYDGGSQFQPPSLRPAEEGRIPPTKL